jgi:hypothetical protein
MERKMKRKLLNCDKITHSHTLLLLLPHIATKNITPSPNSDTEPQSKLIVTSFVELSFSHKLDLPKTNSDPQSTTSLTKPYLKLATSCHGFG